MCCVVVSLFIPSFHSPGKHYRGPFEGPAPEWNDIFCTGYECFSSLLRCGITDDAVFDFFYFFVYGCPNAPLRALSKGSEVKVGVLTRMMSDGKTHYKKVL